jgi:hypothetical protein
MASPRRAPNAPRRLEGVERLASPCRLKNKSRRDMEEADLTDGYLLSDKIKINLHMLGALMLNGVGG